MDEGDPRFKPFTTSRRFSVGARFYRTCVIDGLMQLSPAEHVRRPGVPAESPTLGFTHLQFEALLTAAAIVSAGCRLSARGQRHLPHISAGWSGSGKERLIKQP